MIPARMIADLDAAIGRRGETVTLRRGALAPFADVAVKAIVRAVAPDEIAGGIQAGDVHIILSPTGLAGSAWAAAMPGGAIPRIGDGIVIQGRRKAVTGVNAIHVSDTLVRIELQARA